MSLNISPEGSEKMRYDNLPQELRETGNFNVWRYEQKPDKEKPDKVPVNPRTGGNGQSGNPATYADYRTALAAVDNYDGLGLGVFGVLAIIDIDDCVDTKGTISEMARDIIDTMDSYTEISPSGKGLRVISKASGFKFNKDLYYINNQKIGLEIYIAGFTEKFLTVTGNVIRVEGVDERGEQLQAVLDKYMCRPVVLDVSGVEAQSYLTDDEIIPKATNGKNGAAFEKLWNGDVSDYSSASEADMALAGQLAFYCGRDYDQMERLFTQSGLGGRDKWTEREDYRNRTLCTAIANCKNIYTPDHGKSSAEVDFAENTPHQTASLIKIAAEVESREVPYRRIRCRQ